MAGKPQHESSAWYFLSADNEGLCLISWSLLTWLQKGSWAVVLGMLCPHSKAAWPLKKPTRPNVHQTTPACNKSLRHLFWMCSYYNQHIPYVRCMLPLLFALNQSSASDTSLPNSKQCSCIFNKAFSIVPVHLFTLLL